MNNFKLHFVLLFSLLPLSTSVADDNFERLMSMSLDEIMNVKFIAATGTLKAVKEAPAIATIITAEQIQRSSARTLTEVLQLVPGLKPYHTSSDDMTTFFDIRGIRTASNSQILILINGTPKNDLVLSSTLANFEFPASAIQRIEVIRGPGSAVYGADAFAGTINIVTKDAEYLSEQSQAGFRYGSFSTAEAFINTAAKFDHFKLGINVSYMETDGDSSRIVSADLQSSLDSIFGTSASNAPGALDTRYHILNVNADIEGEHFSANLWAQINRDNGVNAGVTNALDPKGKIDKNRFIADFYYRDQLSKNVLWENKFTLKHYKTDTQWGTLLPEGAVVPIGADGNLFTPGGGIVSFPDGVIGRPGSRENWQGLESTLYFSNIDNHALRFSAGYVHAEVTAFELKNFGPGILDGTEGVVDGTLTDVTGTPYIYLPDKNRNAWFISAQDEIKLADNLDLTIGIRTDKYSDFDSSVNKRVGLLWQITSDWNVKLLYGSAFRAPSMSDLYLQNNPSLVGNKNIAPETIDVFELGLDYHPNKRFYGTINFYQYQAKDLISTVPSAIGLQFNNVGEQDGQGVELVLNYQVTDDVLLSFDTGYRDTENLLTGKPAAGVPKHISHLSLNWNLSENWYLNSDLYLIANTAREAGDNRPEIADYELLNLSIGYKISTQLSFQLLARNLFEQKYVEPSDGDPVGDFPMPGRYVSGELIYRF